MEASIYSNPMATPEWRAKYEYDLAVNCLLPHLRRWNLSIEGTTVLDLGCGTGGLTVALAEQGAICVGVDLDVSFIALASQMAADHGAGAEFVSVDVLNFEQLDQSFEGRWFDLVILSEFVEHLINLGNVVRLMSWLRNHLTPRGSIYVSFPPWFNPFGSHQAGWPIIRYIPWFHLIPQPVKCIVSPRYARQYLEFFQELNHLTICSFEMIIKETQMTIVRRELFHLRPEFYWRYGVSTLRSVVLSKIPIVRELTTTGAFYLLAKP